MTVRYDPEIIRAHAQALYDQARGMVFAWGLAGFVGGGVAGAVLDAAMKSGPIGAVVLGFIGMALGVRSARSRAFVLQLQAQTALCQVAIEANTRRAADAVVSAASPPEGGRLTQVG
ncbi:hypothetical protein HUA74_07285 [Myxococcus sp. CA051A]|uniref:Uncharacterized protein n=1 Tax=Myxococcus llanfairpwllgwyngyllgogerychwyrndrobwllllantysiliogogogochensis TaxID=2590453 RepID=A0A540X195_9BACT|nr:MULTISPECIES: hypothetical protein [Myxococcus]NTX02769.1 hypothetical protein [Myxococcus sp. CA040A]NTX11191.1 hypothetical protein [Myxococcus sp. CA056]NTX34712.1 hypothetical protein [Myxococcus sp. CA033]NTX50341.1 hypothetical protein [Myxococcus sp. CA039A]NTX60461.1 hypothetical protein [Myxococcus sp. CA051A]